ncbi:MAG: ABC transporter ATP-binding protein [Kiritimatiellae bacterium]|nr:ABC transporter ATP-binding protein [Kiritimatiellia bacterium]
MSSDDVIRFERAGKRFAGHGAPVIALDEVSFSAGPGRMVVFMGPSGSGKSTLLHLAGALDTPTRGAVCLGNERVTPDTALHLLAPLRFRVGMVFQRFHLLPHRTARQNVMFRFRYLPGVPASEVAARADAALESVGLGRVARTPARLLSGGEMQRVAIARALAYPPRLLLADEPTGNLDAASASIVLRLFREARDRGIAVLVATHNPEWIDIADEVYDVVGGRLTPRGGGAA